MTSDEPYDLLADYLSSASDMSVRYRPSNRKSVSGKKGTPKKPFSYGTILDEVIIKCGRGSMPYTATHPAYKGFVGRDWNIAKAVQSLLTQIAEKDPRFVSRVSGRFVKTSPKRIARAWEYTKARWVAGMCIVCPIASPTPLKPGHKTMCEKHAAEHSDFCQSITKSRVAEGNCRDCGKPRDGKSTIRCEVHRVMAKDRQAKNRREKQV